jgi:hypothetical protein
MKSIKPALMLGRRALSWFNVLPPNINAGLMLFLLTLMLA